MALAGCESLSGSGELPRDPLFVGQRPVEGRIVSPAPVVLAAVEPMPPIVPPEITNRPAYAQRPPATTPDRVILSRRPERDRARELPPPPRTVPGILTNRSISPDSIVPDSKPQP